MEVGTRAAVAASGESPSQESPWAPFSYATFTVLWLATVISNVGTWMHDVASGWLMTSLAPSPLMVALVQAATTAPVFLFAIPAGALADLVDRRWLLISVMAALSIVAGALGLLVWWEVVDAWGLIFFTFVSGVGAALVAPAWQAIVPQLVPRSELQAAVALNSVGINISRAIGPALAGVVITSFGVAWPYLVNAGSFLVVMAALLWWRPPPRPESHLPAERFWRAVRAGLRYARASGPFRATLTRAVAFFLFGSAYWALLPLVARQELEGGAELYGSLLAMVGAGAVGGALALPRLKKRLGADALVAAGTGGTVLVLVVIAMTSTPAVALGVSAVAGASWIAVLSSLNVSAQVALPDWVRARGLSIFVTVFFGAMTLGSVVWGQVAASYGISVALLAAAGGAAIAGVASWPAKLQQGAALDFSPSLHWPQPVVARELERDHGPVMVTVEYRIDPIRAAEFLAAIGELRDERRRNGAYSWGLFEDVGEAGCYVEYFTEESWLAHLRHHDRVSEADRAIQERVGRFHVGPREPVVRHLLAPGAEQSDVASTTTDGAEEK
jgi:MFS family permease